MGSIIIIGFAVLISAGLLHLGTSLAGIESKSYGKAIITTIACWIVGWVLNGVFGLLHLHTSWFAIIVGLVVNLAIIKSIYGTTWGKAILAWVIEVVAVFIIVGVPLLLFAGALLAGGGMHW